MAYHGLRVTYCDTLNNRFLTLGGAAWETRHERDAAFASIPTCKGDSPFIVDVEDEEGIVDDRQVSAVTVSLLLGKPIEHLVREASSHTC